MSIRWGLKAAKSYHRWAIPQNFSQNLSAKLNYAQIRLGHIVRIVFLPHRVFPL
jgi:hypothetical protein